MMFNDSTGVMVALAVNLVRRFIHYTGFHTTSDPKSNTFPSTRDQMMFAVVLAEELELLGLSEVELDINGYVTATLPSNIPENGPVVGFVAHYDTSPDFNGKDVHPKVIEKYDGGSIMLNQEKNLTLSPEEFPELKHYIGQTLITTDGTSLLGADDKAGIAEIVTAMEGLLSAPEIRHGKIRICFTPDEEIGRGADRFDIQKFGADFAFTVDGGELGELEYENFNAAQATLQITGKSVHPGAAKNRMVNALLVAQRITFMLPPDQRPENTEALEGFFHLVEMSGKVAEARMEYFIRDHDPGKFRQKKELLEEIVHALNKEYGYEVVHLELRDQYYNMREKIEPVMYVVELAKEAMIKAGVEPGIIAIRGGTDGARLSWEGLPCPNIFAGGLNFHGPYEFIPLSSMVKAVEVIQNICQMVPMIRKT
jgi:tripeptide aminopeptidase